MYHHRLNCAAAGVSRAAQNQRAAVDDRQLGASHETRNKTLAGLQTRLSNLIKQRDKEVASQDCNPTRMARFDESIANIQATLARAQRVR